ncbi:MAG: iron-sulfur cluster assembly accessory protein [Acidobacteriota bacterium]
MISFTEKARQKVLAFMEGTENRENLLLRVAIAGRGPAGFTYEFFLDDRAQKKSDDFLLEEEGFTAVVDAASLKDLVGATVDWKETVEGSGFDVNNPNKPAPVQPMEAGPDLSHPLAQRVLEVLEKRINPGLAGHGGFVSLIDVKDHRAYLKLGGGCQGCGLVDVTLKQGIEVMIKEAVPEIKEVIDTTDHAGGTNPYYQPSK